MSREFPSMTALLGLLAIAGYQNRDKIAAGSLFTIEPGLYYPSRGLAVRIEDVVHARPDGTFENLTPIPYDLEIAPAAS